MKRQRSSPSFDSSAKRQCHGLDLHSEWERITGNDIIQAHIESMKERTVLLNNQADHFEDDERHLRTRIGDIFGQKYQVKRKLGEGTFGKVYHCSVLHSEPLIKRNDHKELGCDIMKGEEVAIKVIKAKDKYRSAGFAEINTINLMHQRQPFLDENCTQILDWFAVGNHLCIVFPLLGQSLLELIEGIKYIPMSYIRDIAWQLLVGLSRMHDQELVHTDLKPENILLVDSDFNSSGGELRDLASTEIRIIDFGNSIFVNSYHSRIVATRHYRAPEVLMNLEWNESCDLWAVGCILMELYTRKMLFAPKDDVEHLCMMEKILGNIPSYLGKKAKRESATYFNSSGHLIWDIDHNILSRVSPISKMIDKAHEDFYQLIKALLKYDPIRRCSAPEALRLPFFSRFFIYQRQLDTISLTCETKQISITLSSEGDIEKEKEK